MIPYNQEPLKVIKKNKELASFHLTNENIDWETVNSFGEEWSKFKSFTAEEIKNAGDQYFDIVTDKIINENTIALDVGCGTGRWTKYVAPKVKFVEAIDPSVAIVSADELLKNNTNVRISKASTDNIPFADNSFDFVFSLGVLHHIPDTQKAMINCTKKLKKDGWFLVYLYYNLDNRSAAYKLLFHLSSIFRRIISKFPSWLKLIVCDFIAISVYMPFVFLARILKTLFSSSSIYKKIPLSYYADKSFNIIKNDALDRFGTPLEQRFSKKEIEQMMINAGLTNIIFSNSEPYWHAIGQKI